MDHSVISALVESNESAARRSREQDRRRATFFEQRRRYRALRARNARMRIRTALAVSLRRVAAAIDPCPCPESVRA